MPSASRLACAVLLAAFAMPAPASAQDIFVRPNSGNSAPTVDYGVKARPQQAQPATPSTPTMVAPAPTAQQPIVQPLPQVAAPTPQAQQPAPQQQDTFRTRKGLPPLPPTVASPTPDIKVPPMGSDVQVQNFGKASVFKLNEEPPAAPGQGAGTFSINFKPGALGQQDKGPLLQSFGYSESEVQGNCFFQYGTLLTYSGGQTAFLNSGTAPSLRYNFNPPLEKIIVMPKVACRKLRAPISGISIEQGGYYVNTLTPVECKVTNNTSATVNFSYTGDGTGACQ